MTDILYVSRFPPSPSGVARYAADFQVVLADIGDVSRLHLGEDPRDSQRPGAIFSLLWALIRARLALGPSTVCWFELAGRGIAEFAGAALATQMFERTFVTVHDAPQVTGGVGYLSVLDRRGLRHVASWITRQVGQKWERLLLQRVTRVFVLSQLGSRALSDRLAVASTVLPHVVVTPPPRVKPPRPCVYVPGHVPHGVTDEIWDRLFDVLGRYDARLVLGSSSPGIAIAVRACAVRRGVDLEERGYQDEQDIDSTFASAHIVLRLLPTTPEQTANWAAVGGPVLRALAHGCVVVTNDGRGTVEYLGEDCAVQLGDAAGAPDAIAALLREPSETLSRLMTAARSRHVATTTPQRVRALVQEYIA